MLDVRLILEEYQSKIEWGAGKVSVVSVSGNNVQVNFREPRGNEGWEEQSKGEGVGRNEISGEREMREKTEGGGERMGWKERKEVL